MDSVDASDVVEGVPLSDGEILFITHCVEDDCRIDGRKCADYRTIEIDTGVLPSCDGSAHIQVGESDIMVATTLKVQNKETTDEDKDLVEFSVELSPAAADGMREDEVDQLQDQITDLLNESIKHHVPLKSLCLSTDRSVWSVGIDVHVSCRGSIANLIDAIGVGIKCALHNTRAPRITLDEELDEVDIPDDPSDVVSFDVVDLPIMVTLTKVGPNYIVDATVQEEQGGDCTLVLTIDPKGNICNTRILGVGRVFPKTMYRAIELAKDTAIRLHKELAQKLEEDDVRITRLVKSA